MKRSAFSGPQALLVTMLCLLPARAAAQEATPGATGKPEDKTTEPQKAKEATEAAKLTNATELDKADRDAKAAKDLAELKKAESEDAVALARSGRLLRYGLTGGVAFTLQTPFASVSQVEVASPKVVAMPYLAIFPAYWASGDTRRVYCSNSGWLESEYLAKRAAIGQSRKQAEITLEKIEGYANKILLKARVDVNSWTRAECLKNAANAPDASARCSNVEGTPNAVASHAIWYTETLMQWRRANATDNEKAAAAKVTTPEDRAWFSALESTEQQWLHELLQSQLLRGPKEKTSATTIEGAGSVSSTPAELDANRASLVARIAGDTWTPDDRGSCGLHRVGAYVGRPFDFEADVTFGSSRVRRPISPVASFGFTYMPNGYFSLLAGATVNTTTQGDTNTEQVFHTRTVWTASVGIGGALDAARLLSP